jgi:hypothetical protein
MLRSADKLDTLNNNYIFEGGLVFYELKTTGRQSHFESKKIGRYHEKRNRSSDNSKEKPLQAEVIAVGSGEIVDGKKVPLDVKAGDQVIYSKFSAQK